MLSPYASGCPSFSTRYLYSCYNQHPGTICSGTVDKTTDMGAIVNKTHTWASYVVQQSQLTALYHKFCLIIKTIPYCLLEDTMEMFYLMMHSICLIYGLKVKNH